MAGGKGTYIAYQSLKPIENRVAPTVVESIEREKQRDFVRKQKEDAAELEKYKLENERLAKAQKENDNLEVELVKTSNALKEKDIISGANNKFNSFGYNIVGNIADEIYNIGSKKDISIKDKKILASNLSTTGNRFVNVFNDIQENLNLLSETPEKYSLLSVPDPKLLSSISNGDAEIKYGDDGVSIIYGDNGEKTISLNDLANFAKPLEESIDFTDISRSIANQSGGDDSGLNQSKKRDIDVLVNDSFITEQSKKQLMYRYSPDLFEYKGGILKLKDGITTNGKDYFDAKNKFLSTIYARVNKSIDKSNKPSYTVDYTIKNLDKSFYAEDYNNLDLNYIFDGSEVNILSNDIKKGKYVELGKLRDFSNLGLNVNVGGVQYRILKTINGKKPISDSELGFKQRADETKLENVFFILESSSSLTNEEQIKYNNIKLREAQISSGEFDEDRISVEKLNKDRNTLKILEAKRKNRQRIVSADKISATDFGNIAKELKLSTTQFKNYLLSELESVPKNPKKIKREDLIASEYK